MDWPCNSAELTRRLGYSTEPGQIHVFFVRRILQALDCPKTGDQQQDHYVVDEARGQEVATRMGRVLR